METPKVSPQTIQDVAGLLTNGRKTALLLGSHALYGDGLEHAGRIAAATGAVLLGETMPGRMARGEGSVRVVPIPYLLELALRLLEPYEQLILVGALCPVATFAYENQPVTKIPAACAVSTLATVEHDLVAALDDLARAVGPASRPVARQTRAKPSAPTGELSADAIGRSLCLLLPHEAILVDEAVTMATPIVQHTEGARAHDYLHATCGGAIGGGLPLALGAAVACPDRRTIVLEGDGCGMYALQALWSMAREKAEVIVVLLRNDSYAILEVELARVRQGEANAAMQSMMQLTDPSLDWVSLARGQGVSASRATTAEEFHQQLEAALAGKGPHLIEAQVAQNIQPMIDLVRGSA